MWKENIIYPFSGRKCSFQRAFLHALFGLVCIGSKIIRTSEALTYMQSGFLAGVSPVHIGKLTETKSAATRRVNIAIHLYGWTRRHDLENFSNLLVQFEVGYGTPILGSCNGKERGLKYKECITKRELKKCSLQSHHFPSIICRISVFQLVKVLAGKRRRRLRGVATCQTSDFSRQEIVREKRLQSAVSRQWGWSEDKNFHRRSFSQRTPKYLKTLLMARTEVFFLLHLA